MAPAPTTKKIAPGHLDNPALLAEPYGGERSPEANCATGFNLDEYERAPVSRHDVDLAKPGAVPTSKDCVPASKELTASETLALPTE